MVVSLPDNLQELVIIERPCDIEQSHQGVCAVVKMSAPDPVFMSRVSLITRVLPHLGLHHEFQNLSRGFERGFISGQAIMLDQCAHAADLVALGRSLQPLRIRAEGSAGQSGRHLARMMHEMPGAIFIDTALHREIGAILNPDRSATQSPGQGIDPVHPDRILVTRHEIQHREDGQGIDLGIRRSPGRPGPVKRVIHLAVILNLIEKSLHHPIFDIEFVCHARHGPQARKIPGILGCDIPGQGMHLARQTVVGETLVNSVVVLRLDIICQDIDRKFGMIDKVQRIRQFHIDPAPAGFHLLEVEHPSRCGFCVRDHRNDQEQKEPDHDHDAPGHVFSRHHHPCLPGPANTLMGRWSIFTNPLWITGQPGSWPGTFSRTGWPAR